MNAGGAWWDGEELVEGQDAWFAAFPAWSTDGLVWRAVHLFRIGADYLDTFLSFMEFWWPWVVDAGLGVVCIRFAAAFVDAFLRHCVYAMTVWQED
jgi:hypothetical protein